MTNDNSSKETGSGLVFEGAQAVDMYRLTVMLSGLKMEAKGIKFRANASALKAIKRDFPNLAKRTAAATLPDFEEFVRKAKEEFAAKGNPGVSKI